MKILSLLIAMISLASCSSKPASTATRPNDIFINSTADLGNCKYIGVAQTDNIKNWKNDLRKEAAEKGATHITASGPNNVTGSHEGESVSGNLYFCK